MKPKRSCLLRHYEMSCKTCLFFAISNVAPDDLLFSKILAQRRKEKSKNLTTRAQKAYKG